jgi:serine/threonine-protein kinase
MATAVMPPVPTLPTEGEIIGNYRVRSKLGEGGMGAVYLAEHVHMRSPAVIKVLHPQFAAHPEISARFVSEARLASALKHRNIVTVHDCGQRGTGQWYIAMEFLDGNPLTRLIQSQGGPFPPATIVHILGQAANGLHVAHENGIVHRDVKPENLFLTHLVTNPHHVTILDFGIAKADGTEGDVVTRTNAVVGTPTYMAPEQLRASKDVTRAADIYSLGIVAWEMATGRRLWDGYASPGAILEAQVIGARPLDPCAVLPSIPPAFGATIARALAFRPEDRWPTARAFLLALAHAVPATEWTENGIEILRRFSNELTIVDSDAETAGRPVPVSHVGAPTVRAAVIAPGLPVAQSTPMPGQLGRSPQLPTVRQVPYPPGAEPIVGPSLGPVPPTTLGGAAGQNLTPATMPSPTRRPGRALVAAGFGVLGLGGVIAVAVVSGSGDSVAPTSARAPAPPPTPAPTSALAVMSEPAGASVFVDGTPKGTAPVNLSATVGADVEIRAELADHTTAVERVRIRADSATVRLVLMPIADAGIDADIDASPAPSIDAGTRRVRTRRTNNRPADYDPDGVVQP